MATKVQNDLTLLNQSTRKEVVDIRIRAALLGIAVLASLGLLFWQVQNTALLVAFLALVIVIGAVIFFLRPQTAAKDNDIAKLPTGRLHGWWQINPM